MRDPIHHDERVYPTSRLLHQLVIRPAETRHRNEILEFCRIGHAGYDYIHNVLDTWMHDSEFPLLAGFIYNRPVGIVKMSRLSDTEIWFEGLRVNPDFRGLRLGSLLAREVAKRAEQVHSRHVRFSCYSDNEKSRAIGRDIDFHPHSNWFQLKWSQQQLRDIPASEAEPIEITYQNELFHLMRTSSHYDAMEGLIPVCWTFYNASNAFFLNHQHRMRIMRFGSWPNGGGLLIYHPHNERNEANIDLMLADDEETYHTMVHWFLTRPEIRERQAASVMLPDVSFYRSMAEWYAKQAVCHSVMVMSKNFKTLPTVIV